MVLNRTHLILALALSFTLSAPASMAETALLLDSSGHPKMAAIGGMETPKLAPPPVESATISETDGDRTSNPNPPTATTAAPADLIVDEVKIEGNRLVPTEDIIGVVKTKRGDKYDREQVMQDLKAINGMGYFNDGSLAAQPETTDNKRVLLKIRVEENAPVTEFSFQGNKVLSSDEINKLFSDQLGKPQNLNQMSAAIDRVEQAYHEKGFVLARVTDVKDDPDGSIGLTINEGMIDSIEISGNRKTKGYIIKNGIKLKSGQVYNERQLTADLRKLYANGYFQDIRRSLAPAPNDPDKYVLKVEVDEKRTGSIGLGGGVDTLFGPFGSLSFSDANFRGRGQQLGFSGQVGSGMMNMLSNSINNGGTNFLANQRTYQIEANFVEPNLMGTNTSMSTSLFGRNFGSMMVSETMQRSIGATMNFSKSLGNGFSANLGLTGENTYLKDVASLFTGNNIMDNMVNRAIQTGRATTLQGAQNIANQVRNQQLKGGTYFTVNPSLSYDTRDATIDPTRGTNVRVSASPSLGLSGSSFMKAGVSASKFVKLDDSTTLAFNTQAGTALGAVPSFAGYRLGGWNGMRGYRQFSDLGTGSSMLMATAEVRRRVPFLGSSDNKVLRAIDQRVKIAGFLDFGQVGGNSLSNSLMSQSQMGAAVGFGLRLKLPMVGLVRIDAGLPLISTVLGHTTPRITFGFGEKF